ncbi:MAG: prepilin-type N-terminal cleavage/methylation domain-containing protein [Deltaproteobacteria bacterium]|nr:prepilin-type N-terminal cleavage/methylation domain-containing protein [Deltaproteobacteria bacterium]
MFTEKEIFKRDAARADCKCNAPAMGALGFSLVEVLIALTILSIGILGIMGLIGTSINSGAFAQNASQASNVAQDRIEALQSVAFASVHLSDAVTARTDLRRTCGAATGPANRPVYSCVPTNSITVGTVNPKTYTWTYTVTFIDLDGSTVADESDRLKKLDVTVTYWNSLSRSNKTLTLSSMITN